MRVVTQFCFEPEPVVEWLQRFETEFDAPVRIGLAGPATPATLLKFALRCGVGNSVRALQSQAARFTRLLHLTTLSTVCSPRRRRAAFAPCRGSTCSRSAGCGQPPAGSDRATKKIWPATA
jgi:hypothetical protein